METKKQILARFIPRAALKATTPVAEAAVPHGMIVNGMVGIHVFPFRVGRESRGQMVDGVFHRIERPRRGGGAPTNELYLLDGVEMMQISRAHFQIERTAAGYQVVDLGSVCGISVGGVRIGGNETGGTTALRDEDEIHVGAGVTPYRYIFVALE